MRAALYRVHQVLGNGLQGQNFATSLRMLILFNLYERIVRDQFPRANLVVAFVSCFCRNYCAPQAQMCLLKKNHRSLNYVAMFVGNSEHSEAFGNTVPSSSHLGMILMIVIGVGLVSVIFVIAIFLYRWHTKRSNGLVLFSRSLVHFSRIFEIWYFGHMTCVITRFCFILQNFALIG